MSLTGWIEQGIGGWGRLSDANGSAFDHGSASRDDFEGRRNALDIKLDAAGTIVLTGTRGTVWGQMDGGKLIVTDPLAGDGGVFVSGAEIVKQIGDTVTSYSGKDLRFRVTGGRYDPTVLGAMLRAGYDRSFELLGDGDTGQESALRLGYEGVTVDRDASTVTLPAGVGFDPGGIGKGFAADLLVRDLLEAGAAGACAPK